MSSRKRILIVGPIADFGGREVEAQLIAKSVLSQFSVKLVSTISISSTSNALVRDNNFSWTSIKKVIYSSNFFIRLCSDLTRLINKRDEASWEFIGNSLTNGFFSFNRLYEKILTQIIKESDLVIFCGELTSKWLIETLSLTSDLNIPVLIRTTGTITEIPKGLLLRLNERQQFLVHSKSNYAAFKNFQEANLYILDQTTLSQLKLLSLNINSKDKKLTYGYIGRFGKEKGIINLLKIMESLDNKLIVAGSGSQKEEVLEYCNRNEKYIFKGEIESDEIHRFYDSIDVLIIPSLEEAGPLVGIEAMAAGKIIISTKVGAMSDRLENLENQFWFDIHKPQSLIDVINEVQSLSVKELCHIKQQVRERYLLKYSNKSIGEQYMNVVKQFIS